MKAATVLDKKRESTELKTNKIKIKKIIKIN